MRAGVKKNTQSIEEKQGYDKRPLGSIELKKIVWIPVLAFVLAIIMTVSLLYVIHEAGEGEGKAIESIDFFMDDDYSQEIDELIMEEGLTEEEAKELIKQRD
ncbi:MAG: hypothetical protein PHS19_01605 [Eubacteriales bacterium]|nr:hypothetical protein [Eubacteriales bacterium]